MTDLRFDALTTWPRPSTPADKRASRWTFRNGWDDTLAILDYELAKLSATDVVIQVNYLPGDLRKDGQPRQNARQPVHPGVIVSFTSKHGALRYLTDRYELWQHNVRAIALGLQALRTVDRYAITSDGEQYRGWAAIEAKSSAPPSLVDAFVDAIKAGDDPKGAYRALAKECHPDAGGSAARFPALQEAAERMGLS